MLTVDPMLPPKGEKKAVVSHANCYNYFVNIYAIHSIIRAKKPTIHLVSLPTFDNITNDELADNVNGIMSELVKEMGY